ncbi:MAG: DUF3078 domain-containing protein [Bacteroidetes bacterium]|nr:DUF3078 domain-containing protein [Bacteroidota bacterium]
MIFNFPILNQSKMRSFWQKRQTASKKQFQKALIVFLAVVIPQFTAFPLLAIATNDTVPVQAADTLRYWKDNLKLNLHFSQNTYSNWSVGGENAISGKAGIDYKGRYHKKRISFESGSKLAFGLVGYGLKHIEKTDDRLETSLSLSHKAIRDWTYTTLISFKSQFSASYKYPNDSTVVSDFLAPGYVSASLGMNFRPSDDFEVFISPASGKFTIVTNQELANKGAFGVEKATYDSTGVMVTEGENVLCEFGVNVLTKYSTDITDQVDLSTAINLYNNYLDSDKSNRWNIDVEWETNINFSINKYLQTVLFLHLKYDHNTKIPQYEIIDGSKVLIGEGPRLQFKESLGFGLMYKI